MLNSLKEFDNRNLILKINRFRKSLNKQSYYIQETDMN